MSELLERIENEALSLSTQERAFLADRLLSSLGENPLTDIDAAWIAEAERRYEEYKQGKRPGIPANQVFADELKKMQPPIPLPASKNHSVL